MKKLICFLLGIITGIVLVIGGTAGVGYYFITREAGMGKTADMITKAGLIDASAMPTAIRNKSVYAYAQNVINVAKDFRNKPIGDIETAMGINTFSNLLYNQLGIPKQATKDSTLPDISKTITNHLTVGNVSDKFGVELPDFPIFQNETFLSTPLSTAFSDLDNYTLDSFIFVTYDEDASEEKPASSALLQKLGKKQISDISNDTDGIIDDLELSEIITDPGEGDLINKFLDLKVGELGTKLQERLDGIPLKEIMTIDETSPKVLQALQDCTLVTQYEEDGVTPKTQSLADGLRETHVSALIDTPDGSRIWNYIGNATLDTLGQRVEDMTVSDAIDTEDPGCHILIKRLGSSKISQIGLSLGPVIAETTLGEIITINEETSEPILVALKDTFLKSENLNTAISTLMVKNVFRNYSVGVLGLIDSETPLKLLPGELAAALSDSSLYRLDAVGVYSFDMSEASPETKSYIFNQTPEQLIQSYIDIANDPLLAAQMTPIRLNFSGAELTQDALDNLSGFKSGATLVISNAVTIPDGEVFTSAFNIDATDPAALIAIGEEVSVDLGDTGAGYMFIWGNYFGTIDSARTIKRTVGSVVPAVLIEFI